MLGVDGDAVVVEAATLADVLPSALLLLEIEAGGVWEPDGREHHTEKAEPGDEVELGLGALGSIVVHEGCEQGAQLAYGGGETVSRGSDWGRVHLGCNEEGDCVGTELIKEG